MSNTEAAVEKIAAMIENGTATITEKDTNMSSTVVEGTVESAVEITVETEDSAAKKDPAFIHMPVDNSPELLAVLRKMAAESDPSSKNVPLGPWLQSFVAEKVGVILPVKIDKRKTGEFSSPEEKKAATAAAKVSRKAMIDQLLKDNADKIKAAEDKAKADAILAFNAPKTEES